MAGDRKLWQSSVDLVKFLLVFLVYSYVCKLFYVMFEIHYFSYIMKEYHQKVRMHIKLQIDQYSYNCWPANTIPENVLPYFTPINK